MATEATLLQAVNAALGDAMAHDDRTVLLGQDVGRLGGVFRATQGLLERYPDRVFDTPLAEGGIVGSSIGLALGGVVPIAEIQFLGFLHQAWHQVTQQLARYRYRTRSRYHLPVTIRAPYGGGLRMPEYHPDSIEGQLTNVPGIKVYTPAFPDDAYLMVRAAVADPDPVVVMEPQRLYRSVRGALPESVDVEAPIGVRTRRVGSDVLLVSWGPAVHLCLAAADVLGDQHGVAAGVLDLRSLNPLDDEGLFAAASATPRVVVVHEGVRTSGFGAEVIARLQEALAGTLQLPVRRITAPDTPYPPGRTEDRYLPGVDDVVAAGLRSCDVGAVPS